MVKIEIILFVIIAVILLVLMSKSKFGSVYNNDNTVFAGTGFLDNGPTWIQCDFTLPAATFTNSGTPDFPTGTKYMTYPYIYLFDANEAGVSDVSTIRTSTLYNGVVSTTTLSSTVAADTTQYVPTLAGSVTQAKNLLDLSTIWSNSSLNSTSDTVLSNAEVNGGSVAIKLRIPGSLIKAGMTIGRKYIIGVAPVLNKKPLADGGATQTSTTWNGRRYGNFTYAEFALSAVAGAVTDVEGSLGTIDSVTVTFAAMTSPGTTNIV